MPADRMVHFLDRIRIKETGLIPMKIAPAERNAAREISIGRRKSFADHIEPERLDNCDARPLLCLEISVPIGLKKKFIQVDETNPIGATPAFLPASFKKGHVRVEIRLGPALQSPDLNFRRSAQQLNRTIRRLVIVNDNPIHQRLIVAEKERDNPFLIPASRVKIDRHDKKTVSGVAAAGAKPQRQETPLRLRPFLRCDSGHYDKTSFGLSSRLCSRTGGYVSP